MKKMILQPVHRVYRASMNSFWILWEVVTCLFLLCGIVGLFVVQLLLPQHLYSAVSSMFTHSHVQRNACNTRSLPH